jgi:glycosyltransferase involved in cell wall biosynthesis
MQKQREDRTQEQQMKIVLVIHGYPIRYNAGSEVYTQGLAHALASRLHEVHVFSRQQNKFLSDYQLQEEKDPSDHRVTLHIINLAQSLDQYRHSEVDAQFGRMLDQLQPDLVHIGHLNHLSTSLVFETHQRTIPLVFTLHDYWLMCPRGQFIQIRPKDGTDLWPLCEGQDDRTCAERCYARYFSGAPSELDADLVYWTDWVHRRMAHIREVCAMVDLFIAPSHYLLQRFRDEFGLPAQKLAYLDYGFHRERLRNRRRVSGKPFTFGYIGTHVPAKGVNLLIEAFGRLSGQPLLRIWGRASGVETASLHALTTKLPVAVQDRIAWMGEYGNTEIVEQVLNHCDAIVVPSIWVENSPLVIHEALQARVPVITANSGGMAEQVHHEQNGLLFAHRNPLSLAQQMQRFVDDPVLAHTLGKRGYLHAEDGDVPAMSQHVDILEQLYADVLAHRKENRGDATYPIHPANTTGTVAHHL